MKYRSGRNLTPTDATRTEYYTPILALIKKPSKSFQSLIMKLLTVNANFPKSEPS